MKYIKIIVTFFIVTNKSFAIDFNKYNSALMLLVTKNDNKVYICSSFAVSNEKLLTAAHCLENAKKVKVVREHKLIEKNSYYDVESFNIFTGYDKTKSIYLYDVGIIKLCNSLPQFVNLPKLEVFKDEIEELVRVGFGKRNDINSRTVVFPINDYKNMKNYIDAYDEYSFPGDSGGPIYAEKNGQLFLVGIHSTKDGYNSLNPMITDEVINWVKKY